MVSTSYFRRSCDLRGSRAFPRRSVSPVPRGRRCIRYSSRGLPSGVPNCGYFSELVESSLMVDVAALGDFQRGIAGAGHLGEDLAHLLRRS